MTGPILDDYKLPNRCYKFYRFKSFYEFLNWKFYSDFNEKVYLLFIVY